MLEAFDGMRDTVKGFGRAKAKSVTLAEEFAAIGGGQECITKVLEPGAEWA